MWWFSYRHRTGRRKAPPEERSRKPPSACTVVTISPGCDAMVPSAAVCSIRHTPYYALSMGMSQQFFFLVFCPRWPWPLIFELVWDFCTMHLTANFHYLTFNHSEVIMLKNKLTNKQMPLKTSTSLCYGTPVCNHCTKIRLHYIQ